MEAQKGYQRVTLQALDGRGLSSAPPAPPVLDPSRPVPLSDLASSAWGTHISTGQISCIFQGPNLLPAEAHKP